MILKIPAILVVASTAAICFGAPVIDGSALTAREESPGMPQSEDENRKMN